MFTDFPVLLTILRNFFGHFPISRTDLPHFTADSLQCIVDCLRLLSKFFCNLRIIVPFQIQFQHLVLKFAEPLFDPLMHADYVFPADHDLLRCLLVHQAQLLLGNRFA